VQFNNPIALATTGPYLWVLNSPDNGRAFLNELNIETGRQIQVLASSKYRLDSPDGMCVAAGDLWVSNQGSNRLTVINAASGSLIRVIGLGRYGSSEGPPVQVAGRVWVPIGNAVLELDPKTGVVTHVLRGSRYRLDKPEEIAGDSSHLFVLNAAGPSEIVELSTATATVTRVIKLPDPGGNGAAQSLATAPGSAWALLEGSITQEYSAASGGLVRRLHLNPTSVYFAIDATDGFLWVADEGNGWILQYAWVTGKLVRRIALGSYSSPEVLSANSKFVWAGSWTFDDIDQISISTGRIVRQWASG
jgi:DNA-binding beta-propeller fold protein YncE